MKLVLFDFDGTLTRRDSYLPFLRYMFGTPRFIAGLASTSGPLLAHALGRMPNDVAKTHLMRQFLAGLPLEQIEQAGDSYSREALPSLLRKSTMESLHRHVANGDTCLLVSASLDVYLRPWAHLNGFQAVLCTRLAIDERQCATGELSPANCYGPEKVRRIEQWLEGRRPESITAYGDSPGDREMLAYADYPNWVR
jgi:phosphatidylglycerophosphatase C